jgi:multidrug efflux pump subunit AcrB
LTASGRGNRRELGRAVAADLARNLAANSLANAGARQYLDRLGDQPRSSRDRRAVLGVQPFQPSTTPVTVNHTGTSVSTSIAFNLPEGEALKQALDAIERTMNRDPHADERARRRLRHRQAVSAGHGQHLPAMMLRRRCSRSTSCSACSMKATASR